jgi:hypothetical protein
MAPLFQLPAAALPRVRVFLIDSVRNDIISTGVNEVELRTGRIVREGHGAPSSRPFPAHFLIS